MSGVTDRRAEDLDFAGGQETLDAFGHVLINREHGFQLDDDLSMVYWSSYGFYLRLDLLILGGDFVASVDTVQS